MTVDQLDQLLAGLPDESDEKAAGQIAGLRLAERANASDLTRWQAEFPGERVKKALVALVDASAFLRPPAAEMLAAAPPDAPASEVILARAVEFAKETLPRLPNFYAIRSTTSFEVATEEQLTPPQLMPGPFKANRPKRPNHRALGPAGLNGSAEQKLIWTDSFAETVTYRDGAEVGEQPAGGERRAASLASLTTWGEFGPILRVVLEDAQPNAVVLDRWEKSPHGALAIFRYRVPSAGSHVGMQLAEESKIEYPAYDGEFAVDPATGAVFRITIRTAESSLGFVARAFVMVEFGPTKIAGIDYICPLHGVAMVKYLDPMADEDAKPAPLPYRTSINDITFTNYHVFRTNARIVTGP